MGGSTKGGFHVGVVGGNASFAAGSDMVAGDKITQTTTTNVNNGFKHDDDKQKFLQQMEELRATLRDLVPGREVRANRPRVQERHEHERAECEPAVQPHVTTLPLLLHHGSDFAAPRPPPTRCRP